MFFPSIFQAIPLVAPVPASGRGLWAGVEFGSLNGREACEKLAERGMLAKDTHGTTIRLAPPLVVSQDDLDWALDQLEDIVR
jgi:ornithine--oxo-acid transaminase